MEQADLDAAWHGFSPASSWGVGQLQGAASVSGWEDVGGMCDVRDVLREALELPTKFAKLLARCLQDPLLLWSLRCMQQCL